MLPCLIGPKAVSIELAGVFFDYGHSGGNFPGKGFVRMGGELLCCLEAHV